MGKIDREKTVGDTAFYGFFCTTVVADNIKIVRGHRESEGKILLHKISSSKKVWVGGKISMKCEKVTI